MIRTIIQIPVIVQTLIVIQITIVIQMPIVTQTNPVGSYLKHNYVMSLQES
ncbi:hypothetical protein [Ectobacillus funiculus]|uniref:hypothetical protein n=1 Tax=Ectobacillus funiculus TaxID=137993 RepID=UPI001FEA801C|nr:hypothetical protein [Ectobacillus funiculus]